MAPLKTVLAGGALVAALLAPTTASAASSKGCDGTTTRFTHTLGPDAFITAVACPSGTWRPVAAWAA
jgi:hypothetical protein